MAFQECVIEVAQEQAEAWSDALFDLGALSVSVEDADADTPDEQPLFGEPGLEPTRLAWNRSRVVALFDDETDPALVVAAAANALDVDPVPDYALRAVEDQDWVRLTQSQFAPIRIGERLWVVPSWHDAPEPDAVVLELDPGLAFGTGSHPTTRLCMQWLEQNVRAGETVLDYGCGSGILAIVAKKLGAGDTLGIDIDPKAVEASRYNAERNQVAAASRCRIPYRGHLRPRGGQYPLQSAQADGGHAQCARAPGRPADPVGRAGTAGGRSGRRLCALAGHVGLAQRGRLGLPASAPAPTPPAPPPTLPDSTPWLPPSFVTRCPACRTAFRLVADQLRLRQGLVRCGQCDTVFDAREHLIEVPVPAARLPRRRLRRCRRRCQRLPARAWPLRWPMPSRPRPTRVPMRRKRRSIRASIPAMTCRRSIRRRR